MPGVPGYKPPQNIQPDTKQLEEIRQQKARKLAKDRDTRINKMREEHWLNNPSYFALPDPFKCSKCVFNGETREELDHHWQIEH